MIRAEYQRFMQTLQGQNATESVRKVANIVSAHLDELLPLSTHQGQRIRKMVELCQTSWGRIPTNIPPFLDQEVAPEVPLSRLKTMTVGPFRGFARQEVFDLNSRLVLIYGPNGTGKSSFCEALEYTLLGNVAEADSKRFRDQNEYLRNAFVNELVAPSLVASDTQGNDIAIVPNESAFRFCFVEKNRIDSFSRIAAQAPAKQTELIATLFGLEAFTEFVRNFTSEIGAQYIDLQGQLALRLAQKQQGLQGARQQIQASAIELLRIATEESALANSYRPGISFEQLIVELNGNAQAPGRIALLEAELQQPPPPKSNLSIATFEALGNDVAALVNELRQGQQQLAGVSQQVSFKQLYEAVVQLQQTSPDACPACKTPLQQVQVNPYINAGQELTRLQQLGELQQKVVQLEQSALQAIFKVGQSLNTCLQYFSMNNPLKPFELVNIQLGLQWWNSLFTPLPDANTAWQHLTSQIQQLETKDKQAEEVIRNRVNKQAELNSLRTIAQQITVLTTQKQTALGNQANAQRLIDNFQNENALLIENAEAERPVIARNQEIVAAYSIFVQKLTDYSNRLPAQLVADLGELVVQLYNAFNRNDAQAELLADVKLPLAPNQRLRIAFQHQPEQLFDALHILSEGHVRCLGLAILIAKNLKERAPVLVFDDPVNAIDDDHRESIRRTLFEDQYFSHKQIILTCHGEEFFKDIQNLLSAEDARNAKLLSFLPRLGEQHVRVDFNCAPRNYILAARENMNRNEVRDALAKSRQALEALTKGKIWRYVSRYGDGYLSLKFHSPSSPIELRGLTEQLRSKIGKADFADQNKDQVFGPINQLLSRSGDSREWRYLNKGTHEENDRSEFDRQTVGLIISSLEQIDAALQ
ncbi:MAG: chromosome segregation protein SMC [Oceanospirillaceae bacterium]|nr:chromosome segregation protein SMC [Pseudomonadales bacterium]MBS51750.1 chromosome segregation protein SMC [Oceanospirillaceae bacterium]|tara:strand:+ start:366 stop:2984 length:2619 start_codon:yes stop_codon:yes gene_type:complete